MFDLPPSSIPESDLNIIAQQEAAARSLREQIAPADVYVATNSVGKGRVSVYSYGRSVILNTGVQDTGVLYSDREATVYDFSKYTVSKARNGVHSEFRAEVTFHSGFYYAGRLSDIVRQVIAAHRAQRAALESQFSGEALEAEAQKLEKFYRESQGAASASFSEMVGGFLDSHGQKGETQKIYDSMQAIFAGRPAGSPYTLRELDFAAVSVSAYQSVYHKARQGSEVRQAICMAMVDMKIERMAMHGGANGGLLDVFRQARSDIHRELLDTMDTYFSSCRERGDPARFPEVDRGLFGAAYDTILHAFQMSGDAMTAAGVGAEVAKPLLNEAAKQSPAQRWIEELEDGGFWDTFYYPAYRGGMYEALAADWQSFLSRFETAAGLNGRA